MKGHGKSETPRVLANLDVFRSEEFSHVDKEIVGPAGPGLRGWWRRLRLAVRSYRYDAIFHNCDPMESLATAALLRLLPFNRCLLVCGDPVLMLPASARQRILALVKKIIFNKVDLFILNQRDYAGYSRFYGINEGRVAFVPCRVNFLRAIMEMPIEEGDYAYAGGLTLRDWDTLAEAFRGLDVRLVILIPDEAELRRRGATPLNLPDPGRVGPNVRIVRHSGTDDWLPWVARSKFVIQPILGRSINSSGISTYLSCMALKKCVIISEGPSTRGILGEFQAVIVPPGDPEALRRAILEVDGDDDLRRRTALAGFEHAISLGERDQELRELGKCIIDLLNNDPPLG